MQFNWAHVQHFIYSLINFLCVSIPFAYLLLLLFLVIYYFIYLFFTISIKILMGLCLVETNSSNISINSNSRSSFFFTSFYIFSFNRNVFSIDHTVWNVSFNQTEYIDQFQFSILKQKIGMMDWNIERFWVRTTCDVCL